MYVCCCCCCCCFIYLFWATTRERLSLSPPASERKAGGLDNNNNNDDDDDDISLLLHLWMRYPCWEARMGHWPRAVPSRTMISINATEIGKILFLFIGIKLLMIILLCMCDDDARTHFSSSECVRVGFWFGGRGSFCSREGGGEFRGVTTPINSQNSRSMTHTALPASPSVRKPMANSHLIMRTPNVKCGFLARRK